MEEQRKLKILLLSDDLRAPSGIGTMSREIVLNTARWFDWVQIGSLIHHPDKGKILDLSKSINEELGITDANVKIIPSEDYGNEDLLKSVMAKERPDAVFIFTDPRYWEWLFNIEREIRVQVPIIYYNIWDDVPYPMYNKPFYESCDGLLAISKQTENINKQVLGSDAKNHIIRYIPHGVSHKFRPLDFDDPLVVDMKKKIWPTNEPSFKLFYNARNLGRKKVSDLIAAWQLFCQKIGDKKADKCELVLHTEVVEPVGTDLKAVIDTLCTKHTHVRFVSGKFDTDTLNTLYNCMDGVILTSSNEGWGLSLTEALNTGKMIIANVTGGMQDQMNFMTDDGEPIQFTKDFPSNHRGTYKNHGDWAIPVYPRVHTLSGSPQTPYIFDDIADIGDIAEAIEKLYNLGPEGRLARGKAGYEWATSPEVGLTAKIMGERMKSAILATLEFHANHPRARHECEKVEDIQKQIDYNPLVY
jgi:hypothetical protein